MLNITFIGNSQINYEIIYDLFLLIFDTKLNLIIIIYMFINYCLLFAILDFARSQFINLDLDTNTTLIPSCSREKPKIIYYFNESNKTCWMPFSFILSYLPDDEQIVLYNSMMNNNDNSVCFNISSYFSLISFSVFILFVLLYHRSKRFYLFYLLNP